MPQPNRDGMAISNCLIADERRYIRAEEAKDHDAWIKMLTDEQRLIYDQITDVVCNRQGGVFFVYGFRGTGKTFLWSTLSAAVRCRGEIVLSVASSGIASLLLPGGRITHSKFGIPIHPDESTYCSIDPRSELADLIKETSLIIWDEAPMMSRYSFESLDWSLYDIICNPESKPFGGKVVVFGGDFRQVLPIIQGAGRAEIVLASLNSSYLWDHCKVLTLTKNMRLLNSKLSYAQSEEIKEFSEWLLNIGDGKIAELYDGEAMIDIPEEFLITDADNPIESIVRAIYGDPALLHEEKDPKFFQQRAILAPRNEDVNKLKLYMLEKFKGQEVVYLSADILDPTDSYSNTNPAIVIIGDRIGDIVLIPKVLITPSDTKLPFKMRRRQFPIALAFAMTISKSQGQSLSEVGLYLPKSVFSHGQLYVVLSRVTSKKGLKVIILDKDGKIARQALNVVFKEVFQNLVR
ncbi:PREDICTED: uncharacterized protein LOC104709662 [Camelina sativa]|uniref:ATP-dependent DNA helicase n=1 Tax=Camelina sativa TaxID=90675 RepID=A0ABM0TD46_CAMSA|nr:PREDICTED: uncharacterized protein LOC104709662 [Camelina sativa]